MKKLRFPLWLKTFVVLIATVAIVSVFAIVYTSSTLNSITRNHYTEHSVEVADTLAIYLDTDDIKTVRAAVEAKYKSIDPSERVSNSEWDTPEWEAYLDNFSDILEMPAYQRLFDQIVEFHSKNDALYTCLIYADFDDNVVIYLCDDSEEEERCLPGSFDEFTENDYGIVDHMEEGFYPEITNMPEYGYLVSTGRPVFDDDHKIIAFTLIDLSMDEIVKKENQTTLVLGLALGGLSVGAVVGGFLLVLFLIIHPVRKLTKVANEYTSDSTHTLSKFKDIKINTRDEIEDLSNSMKKMESDINSHIDNLLRAEKKANELRDLADLDALTNLGNKRAYLEVEEKLNLMIKDKTAAFAVVMIDLNDLKVINDTLGHEKGDQAIINLSKMIQKVYAGSNAYRIGGDEFAVILEGEEISKMDELEEKFIKEVEKSIASKDKDEAVSAAIGSAEFDQFNDMNVEDAFKRADRKMYECKKYMKEHR